MPGSCYNKVEVNHYNIYLSIIILFFEEMATSAEVVEIERSDDKNNDDSRTDDTKSDRYFNIL